MLRKIIQIDEAKCNGCGLCAAACHEGAIGIIDGKARLLRDDFCDGLGDCLPACPTDAIRVIEREAAAYDAGAVPAHRSATASTPHICPGAPAQRIARPATDAAAAAAARPSQLGQWPVQIKLLPLTAPYFENARLLIAADCTAYAYASFHEDFMRDRVTLIGCPKLDAVDYSEKLTAIFRDNEIREITVVRMQVPCCGGLTAAVERALQASGKEIPCRAVVVGIDGRLLD